MSRKVITFSVFFYDSVNTKLIFTDLAKQNNIYFNTLIPKSIWRYWCLSLTFAHQAPFDELSLPAEGFEEVSKNDVAVMALSSMKPSDTPAGIGPKERTLHDPRLSKSYWVP